LALLTPLGHTSCSILRLTEHRIVVNATPSHLLQAVLTIMSDITKPKVAWDFNIATFWAGAQVPDWVQKSANLETILSELLASSVNGFRIIDGKFTFDKGKPKLPGNLLGGTLQTRSAGWRVLSLSRAVSDDLVPRLTASRLPQELLQLLRPRRLLADLHLLPAALLRPLLRLRGGAEGQLSEGVRNPARHAGRGCGVGTPGLWLTGPTPPGRRPRCFSSPVVRRFADPTA